MKKLAIILVLLLTLTSAYSFTANKVYATSDQVSAVAEESTTDQALERQDDGQASIVRFKAISSAIAIGLSAAAAAIGMGMAISKSLEAISRQPEAEGKIRTSMMLGMVFIETVVIYALIVAILIIFVL